MIPFQTFDIDYALHKCDLLAVHEFAAGAMENWGLCTFRKNMLLFDEATSDNSAKSSIFGIAAHELAHQWFENLITMTWWNEFWINEGYAVYAVRLFISKLANIFWFCDW